MFDPAPRLRLRSRSPRRVALLGVFCALPLAASLSGMTCGPSDPSPCELDRLGCEPPDGFSESVALGGGNGDALTVDVGGSICVPVQGAPNGSEAGGMVEQVEVAYLTCVGTLESDVEVRLSALTSMEGVPVVFPGRDGSVRSLALRWPDAMMPEPACRRWSF